MPIKRPHDIHTLDNTSSSEDLYHVKTICAWCSREISSETPVNAENTTFNKAKRRENGTIEISHGICKDCLQLELAKVDILASPLGKRRTELIS